MDSDTPQPPARDYRPSLARIVDAGTDRDAYLTALLTINRMCVDALMDTGRRGPVAAFARTVGRALAAIDERRQLAVDGDGFVPVFSMTDILKVEGGEDR